MFHYSDAHVLVSSTITFANTGIVPATIIKNCAPFTDCISEINNTHVDNAIYLYVAMPMYNLSDYSEIIRKHLDVQR